MGRTSKSTRSTPSRISRYVISIIVYITYIFVFALYYSYLLQGQFRFEGISHDNSYERSKSEIIEYGQIIITAFVVIIIGGIGSMKGAFIAAILIGLIDTLGRSFLDDIFKLFMSESAAETSAPAVSAMMIYILMAVVLAFKPLGLFPPKVRG